MGEEKPYIKSEETSFSVRHKVESLVPASNGYRYQLYGERVGEMEENAKSKDGGDRRQSTSLLKSIKLNVL